MPIYVGSTVKQKNSGNFPVVEDIDGYGGFRTVTNTTARDAITTPFKKVGMFVWTESEQKLWRLSSLPNTWTEFTSGGDTVYMNSGRHTSQVVSPVYESLGSASVTTTYDLNFVAIGFTTISSITMNVRLYDVTHGTVKVAPISIDSQIPYKVEYQFTPTDTNAIVYEVQVCIVGSPGVNDNAVLDSAYLTEVL